MDLKELSSNRIFLKFEKKFINFYKNQYIYIKKN